jgi:hypothetical protein
MSPAPWYRRPSLHLAAAVVIAGLSVFWSGQRAIDGVRANLDERLRAAGAGADAALVTLEAEQLSALRAITFTRGVGEALAARNVTKLNALVAPLQANAGVPMVDVVLPDGRVVLAIRSKGAPRPAASRRGMPAIAQSLREARGTRGGRFSTVVVLRTGAVVLTIGPVVVGQRPVGTVLVMTPLADALGRFSQQVGVDLSAYDSSGAPLATTAARAPAPVPQETARTLVGGGPVVMRSLAGTRREALGRLIVNHQAVDVLGASWSDNSQVTGRAVWLYAGLGLLCTVLLLASFRLRIAERRRRR